MSADHQLHYTLGAEGYGTWRLECLPDCPQTDTSGADICWTISWFNELGGECIHGDDWPEGGPWPCQAEFDDGLVLRYAEAHVP